MTKVLRARMRTYSKLTRALIRHLRINGGQSDARAQRLHYKQGHSLARLMRLSEHPGLTDAARLDLANFALGAIGLNDQIAAMLALRPV